MIKLNTYVIYDINNNKIKNRIIEKCKDYGFIKIYQNIFNGYIDKNKIEKFKTELNKILGNNKHMIMLFSLQTDNDIYFYTNKKINRRKNIIENKIYFGMKLNRKFLDFED